LHQKWLFFACFYRFLTTFCQKNCKTPRKRHIFAEKFQQLVVLTNKNRKKQGIFAEDFEQGENFAGKNFRIGKLSTFLYFIASEREGKCRKRSVG
jgi:hypothetical protein